MTYIHAFTVVFILLTVLLWAILAGSIGNKPWTLRSHPSPNLIKLGFDKKRPLINKNTCNFELIWLNWLLIIEKWFVNYTKYGVDFTWINFTLTTTGAVGTVVPLNGRSLWKKKAIRNIVSDVYFVLRVLLIEDRSCPQIVVTWYVYLKGFKIDRQNEMRYR